jgi:hypothetical protein
MKKCHSFLTVILTFSTLVLSALTMTSCVTANGQASPSLQNLLDPNQGIPVYDPADLQATHAELSKAVADGAGIKIKAADNCAVAWLAHPEFQTSAAPAPAVNAPATPTVGPLSEGAALLIKADAATRAIQKKRALFDAGLPDDIVIACAPLEVTVGGVANALHHFLHPSATPAK